MSAHSMKDDPQGRRPEGMATPLPVVLDLEASGFGQGGYPIEVGYAMADGRLFCSLIRPEPDWTHWDPMAERLHRIPRHVLMRHGRSPLEVSQLLNNNLHGRTVYSDGWAHDYPWLALLFDAAGLRPHFKLENLRALLREDEAERWHEVKQQIARERGGQRHRASADARLLQLSLARVREGGYR
ncbi:hypothetical protein [Hylemonella gracilis]|nr:hypothetical protein [Hylemonella gracilis]